MSTSQSKKLVPFYIYEILRKYTDVEQTLTQKDILDKLKDEYGITVERKTLSRNIQELISLSDNVGYTETVKKGKGDETGETEELSAITDLYLVHEFSDGELRLLVDLLRDSDCIQTSQKEKLISKLEDMSGPGFTKGKAYAGLADSVSGSNQLFLNIEDIEDAISDGRMVSFKYKRFVPGINGPVEGTPDEYNVIPYKMQMDGNSYCLICSEDGFNEISLRMDLIYDVDVTLEPVPHAGYNGSKGTVVFSAGKDMVSGFVEEFGKDNIHIEAYGDGLRFTVTADSSTALVFALKHSADVTVIAPESLLRDVSSTLWAGWARYGGIAS